MKKLKQITALIGVIALAGLYVSTLVLALIGNMPRAAPEERWLHRQLLSAD